MYKDKNDFPKFSFRIVNIIAQVFDCDLTESRTPVHGLRTRCPNH